MSAHTYEESKTIARKTIIILGIVTIVEVLIALVGKGYMISGFVPYEWEIGSFPIGLAVMYIAMIALSLYKAILVIFEFMHMKYEVKSLVRSVLLPTTLLIWAIIAFFMEGNYWLNSREYIEQKNMEQVESDMQPIGEKVELESVEDAGH